MAVKRDDVPGTPKVVSQLLGASRRAQGLATLTGREREVLALMAEGRSNAAIAAALVVSAGAVEKHVASIFAKLGLPSFQSIFGFAACSRSSSCSGPNACAPAASHGILSGDAVTVAGMATTEDRVGMLEMRVKKTLEVWAGPGRGRGPG